MKPHTFADKAIAGFTLRDLPGSSYDGACGFAFADGHVEEHSWRYDGTKRPVTFAYLGLEFPRQERGDYDWVLQRMSVSPAELIATRAGSNQVQLVWSQLPANYVLHQTDRFPAGGWTNAGIAPVRSFGQNAVQLPAEGQQWFFRLIKK